MQSVLLDIVENNDAFKKRVKHKFFKLMSNEILINQNEEHHEFYLIKSGKVAVVSKADLENKKQIKPGLSELGAGETVGEFCLFDDAPASATVSTVTDCEICEIDGESFHQFLKENPDIGTEILWEMLTKLVSRIRHGNKAVVELLAWGLKAHKLDEHL